jgi:hypothetical protein
MSELLDTAAPPDDRAGRERVPLQKLMFERVGFETVTRFRYLARRVPLQPNLAAEAASFMFLVRGES